ncbi:MAG: mannose-1-phosphate guanylyltransferase/mannose-6-phosphate isomerase, partial [Desulfobacula sp.]|nr:mannose-1-phosphate guanylyltransferase/mannose-6-phosphate isomerase [Desulfobacula sp.]
ALTVAALASMKMGDDGILLVMPADHVIINIGQYHKAVNEAVNLAEKGMLVTFGIVPTKAETGFGYIRKGESIKDSPAAVISAFVEKPDAATAQAYVDSGEYLWNSGMFVMRASVWLEQLEKLQPDMLTACRQAFQTARKDLDFFRLDTKAFEACPSDSIDYAVMEKTSKGIMIPFDAGWNDLGSFDALWQTGRKDKDLNVIKGDVLTHDVKESYINSESSLIAAVGIEKFVIVETKDAILVSPRDRVQDVKKIVKKLKDLNRDESVTHRKVYRPWGSYETIDIEPRFQVKRITVKPGAKLSLQKHFHRAEHWTVVSGAAIITKGEQQIFLKEDESTYIPLGTLHRLENPGKISLELIEVQSGSYLGEDDIVRF